MMIELDQDLTAEARTIAQADDLPAARAFLGRHPIPADIEPLDPGRLLSLADVAYTAREFAAARRLYLKLASRRPNFYWPQFQVGRIAVESRDVDGAEKAFALAGTLQPDFAWSWYELAALRLRSGRLGQLMEAAAGYLAATPVEIGPVHMSVLKLIGHELYERPDRSVAWSLYEHLWDKGLRDPLIQLRRGEYWLSVGDHPAALTMLEPLDKSFPAGEWALRSLATAYTALGRHEDAASALSEAVARAPANQHFVSDYIAALLKVGRTEDAVAVFDSHAAAQPGPVRDSLRVRLLVYSAQFDTLLEELESGAIGQAPQARGDLLQAIYKTAYDRKAYDLAHRLIATYAARYGDAIELKLCRVNIAFATQDWPSAERELAAVTEAEYAATAELRVKRFEHRCFVGDMEGAALALDGLGSLADLPAEHVPALLRFYAETNAWQDLYEVGMSRLADGFDYGRSGYILFRAIRKTASHGVALTEIERLDDWEQNPSLRKLRTIVMEDMVHNGYMLDEILLDPNVDKSDALHHRLFFKMRVLRGDDAGAKDYAIYFCTNDAYLCATAVSITSLVENNRELMADASLFVAVDSSLAPRATEVLTKLGRKLKVEIAVIRADEIVAPETKFQAGYGLFTGGHSLADAAYYRIYVAHQLAQKRTFKRALYIDSDTVVLSGLEKLFWINSGAPLMARLEEDRPEIEAAIRLHGLAPRRYFNSGVLYFDLGNRDLRARLDLTIQAIADPQCKLMFQDQCALNVGFKGAFSPLREDFNHFIKPDSDGDVETGVVVHFLDRPKPWDPAYPSAVCRLWYTYWHKLAGYVGSADALQLYRAANRG